MSRQIEARECQRCGIESTELEAFLWFDPIDQAWRSGPVCPERKSCRDRAAAQTIADEATFRRIVSRP
jgi:hypothetical protein